MRCFCKLKRLMCLCATLVCGVATAATYYTTVDGIKWEYSVNSDGGATLERYYSGSLDSSVTLPSYVGGYRVTVVGERLFDYYGYYYYYSRISSITVPSGVTTIERDAFAGCEQLTSVAIPANVRSLEGAFAGCGNLQSITLASGSSYLKMKDGMLLSKDGTWLYAATVNGDVRVPSGVKNIGHGAFAGRQVTSATLPSGLESIGSRAFDGCSVLKSVNIPDSVTEIGYSAFEETALESISIPSDVEYIDDDAFSNCRFLKTVKISDGVVEIGSGAFSGCHSLESIAIPGSVEEIHYDAFRNCCSLKSVTFSEGLCYIGDGAFENCVSLESVTIPSTVEEIDGGDGGAFRNCRSLKTVTIRNGVAEIGDDMFKGCVSLESVTIPSSVARVGWGAFEGCRSLKTVAISEGVEEIEEYAFRGCSALKTVTIPSTALVGYEREDRDGEYHLYYNEGVFAGCGALERISVASGNAWHKSVNGLLLSKDGKTLVAGVNGDVSIPSTVTYVECDAFLGLSGLKSLTIPASVTNRLWGSEFAGCAALARFSVASGNRGYKAVDGLLLSKDGRTLVAGVNGDVSIPEGVEVVDDNAFWGRGGLKSVAIPSCVTNVGWGAFADCGALDWFSVAPGNTRYKSVNGLLLSKDGRTLIAGVNGDVWIPQGVEYVEDNAFSGRTGLTSVTIPASVEEIGCCYADDDEDDGMSPFAGCTALRSISVQAGNECYKSENGLLIEDDDDDDWEVVVAGVNGDVTIPDGVLGICEGAFYGLSNLTSVTIPLSMEWIGDEEDCYCHVPPFAGCANLSKVVFKGYAPCFGEECDSENDWCAHFAFPDVPKTCVAVVEKGSTGWDVQIPGTWHGMQIRYAEAADDIGGGGSGGTGSSVPPVSATASALKFAKTAVSVKESAAYVDVTVNRVAKDGRVRVRYATEDGTADNAAFAGEDYVETSGVLEWADGDKKAKKIRVPLIPDLVAAYDGVPSKTFTVRLEPLGADDLDGDERLADVSGGDTCTVTVTETSKANVTVESVYAKKAAKRATVKADEDVPLWSGSFHGILEEDGGVLTNGAPRIATCSVTVSKGAKPSISAKVKVAGKTYSFSGKGWDGEDGDAYVGERTLTRTWKKNGVTYVDELVLSFEGAYDYTSEDGAWQRAGGSAELLLNVPDARGSGVQPDIRYVGGLRRDNSKIQGYLDAAYKFAGYYTVSLSPDTSIGNGYLTLTVDSKGKAKVAGMLADGALKPSVSTAACRVEEDSSSANGWSMFVDVCHSTATVCLGGTLRLYAVEDESNPDGSGVRIVVDSSGLLAWYDDSATGSVATYGDGECISLAPCGGWYDKVMNLQRYYLDYALSVETADVSEFPTDELPNGYDYVWDASPSGFGLALNGDKVTYDKRKIVKTNRLTDFNLSTNVCNVSVKLARATGLVTGGFSLWAEDWESGKQKEMTGFKTYGVLLLARDPSSPLDERVIAPGFATKKVKTTYYDDNGRKKTVTWPFSAPFNIVGD